MPSAQMRAIVRDMKRHCHIFDADRVGEEVLDIAMEQQIRNFAAAVDPDGNPWPDLSEAYFAYKQLNALTTDMGYLEFVMAAPENFRGERFANRTEARSVFGVDEQSKAEAEWFEEGSQAQNRPPRPFTAMGDIAVQLIDDYLDSEHRKQL